VRLGDLAEILPGYPVGGFGTAGSGLYSCAVWGQGERAGTNRRIPARYFSRPGDIVVDLRSGVPVLADEMQKDQAVSSRYLILRCSGAEILPEYLCRLMQTRETALELRRLCRGCVLPEQKAQRYGQLRCRIPADPEDQRLLCAVERQLEREIAEIEQKTQKCLRRIMESK